MNKVEEAKNAENKNGVMTTVKVDIKTILERTKEFGKEFEELCNKYGLVPDMAKDDETNDIFFVVSVRDLIDEKDIDVQIKAGE